MTSGQEDIQFPTKIMKFEFERCTSQKMIFYDDYHEESLEGIKEECGEIFDNNKT